MIAATGPQLENLNNLSFTPAPPPLILDPPLPPTAPQSYADQLNSVSDGILDRLADLGEPFQPSRGSTSSFSIAPELADKASVLDSLGETLGNARNAFVRTGLQSANAFFGATSVLGQFSAEHQAGSRTYEKTVKRAAVGVLQGSLNTSVGIAAAAGVTALGIVGAPAVIIGGGVALGASYLTSAAIERYFN